MRPFLPPPARVLVPALAVAAAALLTSFSRARAGTDPSPGPGLKAFREEVRPLLTAKCLACHGGDRKRGGLDLRRRAGALAGGDSGPAVVPGAAGQSLLYRKLAGRELPPPKRSTPSSPTARPAPTSG